MAQGSQTDNHRLPMSLAPWQAALLGYTAMFSVGTFYALSVLQCELPRLLGVEQTWSYAPFSITSLGLSFGVYLSPSWIARSSARTCATRGAVIWGGAVITLGYFLTQMSFLGILAACFVGGGGVGLAYLGVVILIGQSFPTQPLARSAIGPLGFSSGTATCILARAVLRLDALEVVRFGKLLQIGGVLIIAATLAVSALFGGEDNAAGKFSPPTNNREYRKARFNFSILLFLNALPGMILFGSLFPLAFLHEGRRMERFGDLSPLCVMALALGGIFAPKLSEWFGSRPTFIALFLGRGVLLVLSAIYPSRSLLTVSMTTLLFAHGTGFSLLPGLLQRSLENPLYFAHAYGEILILWGVAGVLGGIFNAVFIPATGESLEGRVAVGIMALVSSWAVYTFPSLVLPQGV